MPTSGLTLSGFGHYRFGIKQRQTEATKLYIQLYSVKNVHCYHIKFLADHTNGHTYATVLHPPITVVICLSVCRL